MKLPTSSAFAMAVIVLTGTTPCRVHAGDPRFDVAPVSEYRYRVRIDLTAIQNARDMADLAIPGAVRIDRDANGRAPAFVRVLELNSGRSVDVESLTWSLRTVTDCEALDRVAADDKMLSVTLARMGRRVFARIEARPFQPDPVSGQWRLYTTIDAVFRVSGEVMESQTPGAIRHRTALPVSGCRTCPPPVPLGVSAGMGGTPADFSPHRSVTNSVAWKIEVSQPGLYRVTKADLLVAGVPDAYHDTSMLQVSCRDQVLPVWRSTDGPMGEDDWLMFYGAPVSGAATTRNVYWLSTIDTSPMPETISAEPTIDSAFVTSSWHTVEYAPKTFYRASHNPLDDSYDHWFAMEVAGGTMSNIAFMTPCPVRTGEVYLAYSIHGADAQPDVDPDHRSILRLEGITALDTTYNGRVRITGSVAVPATAVQDGISVVSLEQPVLPGVIPGRASAFIEWLRLCYQRQLLADELPFYFKGPDGPANVQIGGIPTNDVWLLDVSDPLAPKQMQDYTLAAGDDGWTLRFRDHEGGAKCFGLLHRPSVRPVGEMMLARFRNLSDPARQADYLLVTPAAFREPVYRLLKHRYKNGLSVQVATVDDVYNEFSYGVKDPVAIRRYFGYAYHHYAKDEPRYALLIGTGSFDPADYLGTGALGHVPVYLGPAPWRRTAFEQWYVTVDGPDLLPDIRLGRIPARTLAEVEHAVAKIIDFETTEADAPWRATALLVADKADAAHDFKAFTENNTRSHLEKGGFDPLFGIQKAYRDDLSQTIVRQTIQGALDSGVHLMHFMGHGGVRQWCSPSVWNVDNALAANNTIYPIVTVFTCQNGLFFDPVETCLVQAMLLNAGSASGMVAPTALAVQLYSEKLADGFYAALADDDDRDERLGDALQEGFLRLWTFNPNVAELRFYAIFGDPAQQIWGGARQ